MADGTVMDGVDGLHQGVVLAAKIGGRVAARRGYEA